MIISSRKQAIRFGFENGITDVCERQTDTCFDDDGNTVSSFSGTADGIDEAAINAGVASALGVPKRWERVFYAAYQRGAEFAVRTGEEAVQS